MSAKIDISRSGSTVLLVSQTLVRPMDIRIRSHSRLVASEYNVLHVESVSLSALALV